MNKNVSTNGRASSQETKVVPGFLKDFFSDRMMNSALHSHMQNLRTELTRSREAAEKRKLAAEKEMKAIDVHLGELQVMLKSIGVIDSIEPPSTALTVPAKTKTGGGKCARGQATTSEVVAALKKVGAQGMTLAALRYAVGNKLIKRAIHRLKDHVLIPPKQGRRGSGLIIRLV